MRGRVVSVAVLAGLVGAGVFYTAVASGRQRVPSCASVHVSGGNFNGLTGGTIVAAVKVRNLSSRDCTINARPWIRLGPTSHAVTVADAAPNMFGKFGSPEQVLKLRPGQHTVAQVFISPGSCSRARSTVFPLEARAGWAGRSVPINNVVCKNGSGEIWIGSFQP
jgi:hypothetical protein